MIFFNTLLFNWVKEDTALCGRYMSVDDCLAEPSKIASLKSMCYWDHSMATENLSNGTTLSYCFPSTPSRSEDLVFTVAIISALLSIPVILLLESIVVHLLCRPVLSPKQVIPSSLLNEKFEDNVGWGQHSHGRFFKCGSLRVGIESDVELFHDVTLDMRQLLFDLQQYRGGLRRKVLIDFDSRWGFTRTQIQELLTEIEGYLSMVRGGLNENEVIVGRESKLHKVKSTVITWLSAFKDNPLAPPFKVKGFRRLWSDLLDVRLKAEAEIAHIETLPLNDLKGDRMMLLFKHDLLQGILSEVVAKLYLARLVARTSSTLSEFYLRNRVHISKGQRYLGCLLLGLFNSFFLLYIFLYSLRQTELGYSDKWLRGFMFWLALEVFFISTVSMIMAHITPLVMAFKGLREANRLFRAVIVNVFSNKEGGDWKHSCTNTAGEVVRDTERPLAVQPVVACEEPFNCSPYFFVSRRVAKAFPNLIESTVIEYFRSVVPNKPYSQGREPMRYERISVKLAVFIQNISIVILYCILEVVTSIPALEYYVSSALGWLMFGFMARVGGFTMLGVHITFSGYLFLVFVVLFYISLFFIGHRAFKIVQKEYDQGRERYISKEELRLKINKDKEQHAAKRIGTLKFMNAKKLKANAIAPEPCEDDNSEPEIEEEKKSDDEDESPSSERFPLDNIETRNTELLDKDKMEETIAEIEASLLDSKPIKYLRSRGVVVDEEDDVADYYDMAQDLMEKEIRENSEIHDLMALDKYDSDSDSSDDAIGDLRNRVVDFNHEDIPLHGTKHGDDETSCEDYLASKGISFENEQKMSKEKCLLFAKHMKKVEAQAQELAMLKALVADDSSDSDDSDSWQSSDDDEDIDEEDALHAYRYLESLGLVLADNFEVADCVKLAELLSNDDEFSGT